MTFEGRQLAKVAEIEGVDSLRRTFGRTGQEQGIIDLGPRNPRIPHHGQCLEILLRREWYYRTGGHNIVRDDAGRLRRAGSAHA